MKKTVFILGLSIFCFFVGTTEAAPKVLQQEIVDLLKPKLNSDRIEYFFGSYGVDALKMESSVFPSSRIANLYSIHDGKKIMRTLAIVDFFQPVHSDLTEVHQQIIEGKSIGIALKEKGWVIRKIPVYFGVTSLSPKIMNWMSEPSVDQGAVHVYRLEVTKTNSDNSIPYCTILEVHSPQYLTADWLQAIYQNQYTEFSTKTQEIEELLLRLSCLIEEFPVES